MLVILIGGHWAILQTAAWAGMLVTYAKSSSLEVAWTKTFDGEHPCKLCKVVRDGKKSERKQDLLLKVEVKYDSSFTPGAAWLYPPCPGSSFVVHDSNALTRLEPPLTPPPRHV